MHLGRMRSPSVHRGEWGKRPSAAEGRRQRCATRRSRRGQTRTDAAPLASTSSSVSGWECWARILPARSRSRQWRS